MIQAWHFAWSIFRYPKFKNSRWPSRFSPYSRWPPINKMAAYIGSDIFNIVKIFFKQSYDFWRKYWNMER